MPDGLVQLGLLGLLIGSSELVVSITLPDGFSTVGKSMLRQWIDGGYDAPGGGCGRRDAGPCCTVPGKASGRRAGRCDAPAGGSGERSKVVEK